MNEDRLKDIVKTSIEDIMSKENTISNNIFLGLALLISAIGGRMIYTELQLCCNSMLKHTLIKLFILFCMLFIYIRDTLIILITIVLFVFIYLQFIKKDFTGLCDDMSGLQHEEKKKKLEKALAMLEEDE